MAPFSKEMLLQDFAAGLQAFGREMVRLVGLQRADALVATASLDAATHPAQLIRGLPGGDLLEDAYDFAFEGRLRYGSFWDEIQAKDGLGRLFAGLSRSVAHAEGPAFERCLRTIHVAERRCLLDASFAFITRGPLYRHISLADLALLAGLDEKTLRNLASSRGTQRLQTAKIDGRTCVSLHLARAWLESRGFVPTVCEDQRPERDFARSPLASTLDLAEYVRALRGQRGYSKEELANRMLSPSALAVVQAIEARGALVDEAAVVQLGKALALDDPESFGRSAMNLQRTSEDTLPGVFRRRWPVFPAPTGRAVRGRT